MILSCAFCLASLWFFHAELVEFLVFCLVDAIQRIIIRCRCCVGDFQKYTELSADEDTCSTASLNSWLDYDDDDDDDDDDDAPSSVFLKSCLRRNRQRRRRGCFSPSSSSSPAKQQQHTLRFTTTSIREYYPLHKETVSSSLSDEEHMLPVDDWEFQRWQDKMQRVDKNSVPRKRYCTLSSDETPAVVKKSLATSSRRKKYHLRNLLRKARRSSSLRRRQRQ